jgi:hypothetical protein
MPGVRTPAPRRMQGRRVYIVPRKGLVKRCKRTEKLQKRASDPLTCNRTLEGRRSRQRRDSQAAGMRACHGFTPVFFAAGVLCPLVAWVLARAAPGGAAGALHAVPPLPSPPTSPALTVGLQVVPHALQCRSAGRVRGSAIAQVSDLHISQYLPSREAALREFASRVVRDVVRPSWVLVTGGCAVP